MESVQPQLALFNHIKAKLSAHLSMVDEIAELLDISNDSAYRRIRGEKAIGLNELQKLCKHYKVSLDQLLQLDSDTVVFSGKLVDHSTFNMNSYLHDVLNALTLFKSLPDRQLYNFNKDIPIFHYMQFPELSAFKFFFWKRTLMHYPDLAKQQFKGEEHDTDIQETGLKIIRTYTEIPSTEIWNDESIHSTIRQIEFYRQTNVFASKHIILKVYGQLEELINHLELEAEAGVKFLFNHKPNDSSASFHIYLNECLLGDNSVHVHSPHMNITSINHGGMNFMTTMDTRFCDYTYNNLQNIIRKSTHISVIGEKERSMFFNSMREKIYEKKKNIL